MKARINAFWDWFVRNDRRLRQHGESANAVAKELLQHLQGIHPGITYELGFDPDCGLNFIVSADGNRELFVLVHRIVDAAPHLVGWTFTPLRPRRALPFRAGIGEFDIDSDSIWFSGKPNDGLLDLTLYFRDFIDDRMIYAIAFLLLEVALGEYHTQTKIGRVSCIQAPRDPTEEDLLPFNALPGLVDSFAAV